ncbi:MAG: TIGR03960 family B12-binding radical SAM protein [Candidatus Eremiobacterota bacterium]
MNNIKEKIEKLLLPSVEKPERYIGQEVNSFIKPKEGSVSIALAFPDVYEVGFSNIGFKILYHLINREEKFLAERAYCPWFDAEAIMIKEDIPLTTVETWTPLKELDIIGFTLQHELTYTNIISMLSLSHIPLSSCERPDGPLVIAGGSGSFNSAPIDNFIDLFVLGEGEEVILEILEAFYRWKFLEKGTKIELLKRLSKIAGVYVPSFYEITYHSSGEIERVIQKEGPDKVEKRVVSDLDKTFFPEKILTPLMEVIHDRAVIEIFRGCTRGCRFCQAGYIYRPVRERSLQTCLDLAQKLLDNTGYPDLSLSSLSTTDYSSIEMLLKNLMHSQKHDKIAISLPSMRIDTFSAKLAEEVQKVRKTGFTFAPEAGSERLRRVINKQVTEEDLLKTVEATLSAGWDKLKLYFMIGLPTETEEDLEEIVKLIKKVFTIGKKYKLSRISVAFSSFVPKPHTPFQWEGQDSMERLKEKQNFLFKNLKTGKEQKKIFINFHKREQSFIEAVFARGDRRLGEVLLKARELGCRFDNWSDYFRFDLWQEAFNSANISPSFYANRARKEEEILPWDHISSGIDKAFLLDERKKALEYLETKDCRFSECSQCGVCQSLGVTNKLYPQSEKIPDIKPQKEISEVTENKTLIRFNFEKIDKTKFISHLGLIRIMERAVRFTGLPVAFSQGFNPKPKIALGPPLSSGIESYSEWGDIVMAQPVDTELFQKEINRFLPEGMKVLQCSIIPLKSPALNAMIKIGVYSIECSGEKDKIEDFLKQDEILFKKVRKKGTKTIDIKPLIKKLEIREVNNDKISMELWINMEEGGTIKPQEVIKVMNDSGINLSIEKICRMKLLTVDGKSPLENY